jgi:type VI secretion system protein ImpJ
MLAQLIGHLSTFAAETDLLNLPKFNYVELGEPFEVMFARVLSLLSGGIEHSYVEIPLEHRSDGMFIGKIPEPHLAQHEFFAAVTAPMPEPLIRERVPAVLKVAAWNHIYEVVKHARHGVRVEIEWKPSGALPVKPGTVFFKVQRQGTYWDEVSKTSTIALYVPNEADWTGTALNLYVVDPKFLR